MPSLPILVGLLLGAALAAASVPLMIRLGHNYGLLDMPGRHKRHKKPTPFLGGVALFASVWVAIGVAMLLFPSLFEDIRGSVVFILLGSVVICGLGLLDDLSPISAWIKLSGQILAGVILYWGSLRVGLLSTPWGSLDIGIISWLITILWVVGLTNAINLIDGLDGLASGVSLIGAITMAVIGQLYQIGPVLVLIYVLVGFLAVFLVYNRYPARIFLGDSGSMQIGYYFAVCSLVFPLKSFTATALYVPLLALGVPVLEALSSTVRRLLSGKNIMKADRRHLFHYLSLAGFSPRKVVLIFYLLALVFGGFAVAMCFLNRLVVFGFLVIFMVVILAAFFILIINLFPRKRFDKPGA